jgi:hypothetical protein
MNGAVPPPTKLLEESKKKKCIFHVPLVLTGVHQLEEFCLLAAFRLTLKPF